MDFRANLWQSNSHSNWLVLNAPIVARFKRPLTISCLADPFGYEMGSDSNEEDANNTPHYNCYFGFSSHETIPPLTCPAYSPIRDS